MGTTEGSPWPPPDAYEVHVRSCRGRWTIAFLSDWDDSIEHADHWDRKSSALEALGNTSVRMRAAGLKMPTPGRGTS